MSAKDAYKSYVRAYDSHHLKTIFDINTLDLEKVALSFGFRVPPAVDLLSTSGKPHRPSKRTGGGGYGYFNKMNQPGNARRDTKTNMYRQPKPGFKNKGGGYGKRDNRQFSR